MARGGWANFPAAAVDAGLEKQKKQRFVAHSRRCHQECCVALAHAYCICRAYKSPEVKERMTLGAVFLGSTFFWRGPRVGSIS